jgi:histidinol dehydrogenase
MMPTVLTRLDLRGGAPDFDVILPPPPSADDVGGEVRAIVTEVRARGDAALRELTERFDGWEGDDLRVPRAALQDALDATAPSVRAALEHARDAISAYHEAQLHESPRVDRVGMELREVVRAVDRAGIYVPGGRAAYPSTVLMTAVPAQLAGVPELVMCTPAGSDGEVAAPTLAAAALVGIDEVYRVGGAQAIAALAFGTDTIRAVDVIVGPGNAYVAAAKRMVNGVVGIDAFAGPSEVVVVADSTAPAALIAADLLAQAEHGPGGTAVVITWEPTVADAVDAAVGELVHDTARRTDIEATLRAGGRIVVVDGPGEAMAAVNTIAPEHLELITANADELVPLVRNAGAVFVGPWAPAAIGDYIAGVNHVLPTARTARFASALRVDTFRKHIHVVRMTREGFDAVADDVQALAAVEGLPAHARSVALRQSLPTPQDVS